MMNNIPKFAQKPIKNYLQTGQFRDHQKFPIENDETTKAEVNQMIAQNETFMAADNTPEDLNPAPGKIDTTDDFFGPVHAEFEKSDDGKGFDMFYQLGQGNQSAVVYTRNSPESLDVITVTPNGQGGSDGVMHISHTQQNGSFMTFKPEAG